MWAVCWTEKYVKVTSYSKETIQTQLGRLSYSAFHNHATLENPNYEAYLKAQYCEINKERYLLMGVSNQMPRDKVLAIRQDLAFAFLQIIDT